MGKIILLITIDSLRKDTIGRYTNNEQLTPAINSLAENGTLYENAFSQGGETSEAFPSIMCSSQPPTDLRERIVRDKTLAERLRENGFTTIALHSNPYLSHGFGYDRGFDHFFDYTISQQVAQKRLGRMALGIRLAVLNKPPVVEALPLVTRATSILKQTSNKSIFLWLHFMDTHSPFIGRSSELGLSDSIKNRILWNLIAYRTLGARLTVVDPRTKKLILKSYKACVNRIDQAVSILIDEVSKLFEERLIILTGDHGEAFWEHGYFGHGRGGIYEENLSVPMVFTGNGIPKGRRVTSTALHADIMPTILERIGQPIDFQTHGQNILSERSEEGHRHFLCTSLDDFTHQRTLGLRYADNKYIRREHMNGRTLIKEEFYDLRLDKHEVSDISATHSEVSTLRSRLLADYEGEQINLTKEEELVLMQKFKFLGYE